MPTFTLTFPANQTNRIVDALSTRFGYKLVLDDGITPNPINKNEFVRLKIAQWIKDEVHNHESGTAIAIAASSITDVDIT